ncbi:two-component system sensor histidine kinase NtrB [Geothrix limicola]|nr:ATP-binding protein [Geothrix limicola]
MSGLAPDPRMERGLASALDQVPEGLALLDAKTGTLLHSNAAFSRIFNQSGPWPAGQNLLDLFGPEVQYNILATALDQARTGKAWMGRVFLRTRAGREIWFEGTLSPVQNEQGLVESLIVRLRDITLESGNDWHPRVAQRMGTLGALARGVAHDFNNLIGVVLTTVDLMEMQVGPDSRIQSKFEIIRRVGGRAKELASQIMNFSRRSDGPWTPVDFTSLMEEVAKLLQNALPENVQLRSDIAEGLEVPGDSSQLHQVIMNLGFNASQAMQPAGGELYIQVQKVANEQGLVDPSYSGPCIQLTVEDTGCGMSVQTMERIFEPFFTTKDAGQGTGLGLSVVHDIIQRHGGNLRVSSRPGHGSSFQVFLPVYQDRRQGHRAHVAPSQINGLGQNHASSR